MATKTQTLPEAGGFIVSEADGQRSREAITVKSGENLKAGAVITGVDGTVTVAASAGNTGDGTMAATPTGVAGVVEGDYQLVIIEPATDAGAFALYRPDGSLVETGTVAVAFSNELSFTLQDGATDFAAGDNITITVAAPKWIERAVTVAARGLLYADVDASAADADGVAVVRDAEVAEAELVHVTGATAGQKADAVADLKQAGIIAR